MKILLNDSSYTVGITQLAKLGWVVEKNKDNCQGRFIKKITIGPK